MKVERVICVYDKSTEEFLFDINIDHIPFDTIKEMIGSREGDPLLYDAYPIEEEVAERINAYLSDDMKLDFARYDFFLQTFQAS